MGSCCQEPQSCCWQTRLWSVSWMMCASKLRPDWTQWKIGRCPSPPLLSRPSACSTTVGVRARDARRALAGMGPHVRLQIWHAVGSVQCDARAASPSQGRRISAAAVPRLAALRGFTAPCRQGSSVYIHGHLGHRQISLTMNTYAHLGTARGLVEARSRWSAPGSAHSTNVHPGPGHARSSHVAPVEARPPG